MLLRKLQVNINEIIHLINTLNLNIWANVLLFIIFLQWRIKDIILIFNLVLQLIHWIQMISQLIKWNKLFLKSELFILKMKVFWCIF